MKRRKKNDINSGGLFPFLSILSGLIGVMILLICVAAIGEIAPSKADDQAAADQLDEQIARLEALETGADRVNPDSIEDMRRQVERLRINLDLLPDVPDDVKQKIKLVSFGTGTALRPFFIECDAEGLLIHSSGARVALDEIATDQTLAKELDSVQNAKRAVLFLIREDGVKTYQKAVRVARETCERVGAVPVMNDATLDVSEIEKDGN
ncbi:MAG: hypothetical protein ABIH86_03585 [Planctomycetota bacterium]